MDAETRARVFVDGSFAKFVVDDEPYVAIFKELIEGVEQDCMHRALDAIRIGPCGTALEVIAARRAIRAAFENRS